MMKKAHLAIFAGSLVIIAITASLVTHPLDQKSRGVAQIQNALALSKPPTNPYANLNPGIDISYPQCKLGLTAPPSTFVIIGTTKGRAFTTNPCLNLEYQWAQAAKVPISFYMNLNFPSGSSADRGMSGPKGECQKSDLKCQGYNYGWNAAADAKTYTNSLWLASKIWWLDIETYNTWEFNGELNKETIQGAIDFFHKNSLTVGIYTAPRMWAAITDGNYDPNVPIWIAGAHSDLEAKNFCGLNIGSGPTWLSQYGDGGEYDRNLICQ